MISQNLSGGLYIHIPFCLTKCMYCDFYSVPDKSNRISAFVQALITEIEHSPYRNGGWQIDTIFIGGGTPTILGSRYLDSIVEALHKRFDLSNVKEFTIETNPGELKAELLSALQTFGIDRLSIGVQSFQEKYLRFLTRIHSGEQAVQTIKMAQEAGFVNINADLIFGIPGQNLAEWERDLQTALELDLQHISAYALTVEPDTQLNTLVSSAKITMPKDELSLKLFHATRRIMSENGYPAYELSNFSKPGFACRHNLHYWKIEPYLAFGPSAHGFDGLTRWSNVADLHQYISTIEKGQMPVKDSYQVDEVEYANEIIGFGLRLTKGFDINQLPESVRPAFLKQYQYVNSIYPECIKQTENRICLTEKGLAFADAIAADFIITC